MVRVLGLHARLTNNLILSNIMQAFTEELFLNTKAGFDPDLVLDTLNNSAARNRLIAFKALCFQWDSPTSLSPAWMARTLAWRWTRKRTRSLITLDQFDPAGASSGCRQEGQRGTVLL
jgi:hypothetical protein